MNKFTKILLIGLIIVLVLAYVVYAASTFANVNVDGVLNMTTGNIVDIVNLSFSNGAVITGV